MGIRDIDPKMLEYGISFKLKVSGLQEMYFGTIQNVKELEEAQKEESAEVRAAIDSGKVFPEAETGKAYVKSIACFEAYLNALYSLLQVVTKITLMIYQKSKNQIEREEMGDNFGKMFNYLKNVNRNVDSDFTIYLDQKMGWYEAFRNNRRKITHDGSVILLFTQNDEIARADLKTTSRKDMRICLTFLISTSSISAN